jgi:hypothetical protein
MRGQGHLRLNNLFQRMVRGLVALITQGRILRNRKLTSLLHYGVAWGFIFYGLVNAHRHHRRLRGRDFHIPWYRWARSTGC